MSITLMSEVFSKFPHGGNKKLVLLAIADHANDDGYAWPAVELIAVKCNISRRYVQEITAELVGMGWLKIRRPDADNGRITNLYEVVIPEDAHDAVAERKAQLKERQARSGQRRHEPQFIVPEAGDEPGFTPGVNYSSSKPSLEPSVNTYAAKDAATTAEQERLTQEEQTNSSVLKGSPSAKKSTRPAAPEEDWTKLTEGQRLLLECFGAKRYKTKTQRDTIAALETDFGYDQLARKIKWAANKGMAMGTAIVSIDTALRNPRGKPAKHVATANPGKPGRTVVDVLNVKGL